MPNDPKHVLYVWVDALTNYITALGYMSDNDELFKKYWPADLQIVGKDIIRFHGIYWPIFLKALGLEQPKEIYAHGYIVMKDGKMSKSKGNVVYPEMLIERYGLDATRYYLLSEMTFGQDSLFTPEDFVERFNTDLCNDLGNLLNRTIGMINKYFGGHIPTDLTKSNEIDANLQEFINTQLIKVERLIDTYHISNALAEIWGIISRTNKYIDETMPWVLAKEENTARLGIVMFNLAETLRKIAILITPFLSETAVKMFNQLGINNKELQSWDSIKNAKLEPNTKVIEKGEPLFIRLDVNEEVEYIKANMK